MSTSVSLDIRQSTERCFTIVKSIHEFDRIEVRSVIDTLLSPSRREQCFIGIYLRSIANIATLLELKRAKHFQAIVMLTRSLFELAVDIRLIGVIPDSCEKMIEFVDVEKLRTARKALRFKAAHPSAQVETTIYDTFIASNGSRIEAARRALWPKPETMSHWSGMRMSGRVKLLNPPFEEIYEVHYPQLSWQVHSGLTGIVNLKAETFTVMCGQAFKLAADSHRETLLTMIDEFKLEKANRKIKAKLKVATLLPFTDTKEQEDSLREFASPD
ncbi:MAG: DUF5677 domain-containing protein [Candidatus Sulfotelmatobacter sp.]|jgi:hypothetical protein